MAPIFLLILLTIFSGNLFAADSTPPAKISIDQWLVAGPYRVAMPAFADPANSSADLIIAADAVDVSTLKPRVGDDLNLSPGQTLKWTRQKTKQFNWPDNPLRPGAVYVASYLSAERSEQVTLSITSEKHSEFVAYLDGKLLEEKPKTQGDNLEQIYESLLHHGKHLLLVKSVCSHSGSPWTLKATITFEKRADQDSISVSTDPRRALTNFSDITLFDNLSSPTLSPDGQWLAVIRSHREKNLKSESWLEIYESKTAKLARTLRPLKGLDHPFFFPKSDKLGFTTAGDSGSTIWVMDMKGGQVSPAVKNIVGLQRLVCSPDGQFIYFSADEEKKTEADKPSLWTALEDRMSDWTDTRKIYVASLSSGAIHEISATGDFAADEFALSHDGNKLLITRRLSQVGRPYYSTEFWTYDIPSGKASQVLSAPIPWERRPQSLTWLPGGDLVVYTASRHMVEPGDTANHDLIECSLWLLDVHTGKAWNLSAEENFSTGENEGGSTLFWNEREKNLWLQVMVGGRVEVMKTDPYSKVPKFTAVSLMFPFVGDFDMTANGQCAFTASNPVTPAALYFSEAGRAPKLISNPAKDILPSVELATYEKWNFTDSLGYSIDGWIYYPPHFSPDKKWPLVVYYYGGTYPRDERFSFTYHWWAANGYVVYVLNPSGAMGYSEKFAELHANDWGTLATRDIIEGTRKLLSAKPFIDPKKMAAYGGSYGGFITMDLATKTDMFAALVSDAGISDIASYFGGGTWGFTYGDIALPQSFPWNRPDIFAGKSPLYHADKIHTPLLLIHGLADDNVPPIESAEMFTALKVLGRDVAFARFPNEDHSIAIKFSDLVDYREMMLAWFDNYLKGESAAWNEIITKAGK